MTVPEAHAHAPRITFWIHGKPGAVEGIRARALAADLPADNVQWLWRDGGRWATRKHWAAGTRAFRPDLLYVLNTANPGALLASGISRRLRIPYILDTGDAIYEMAKRSGVGAGWRLPFLRFFENHAQRHARTIVVRGTRHREHLLALGHPRVELIRDGYSEQQDVPAARIHELRQRLGLGSDFVVGLMGSLVWSPRLQCCYGWDLVRALPSLRELSVKALVIGDGNGLDWLRAEARRLGVADRVVFAGRIPYAEVPAHLRVMEIALSTQTNNLPGQVRTTGKVPEYMAAGRFILASRVGEATLLLPEPMLVDFDGEMDPAYPGKLAARIRQVHSSPALLALRDSLPDIAARECSYPVLRRRWIQVVRATLAATS